LYICGSAANRSGEGEEVCKDVSSVLGLVWVIFHGVVGQRLLVLGWGWGVNRARVLGRDRDRETETEIETEVRDRAIGDSTNCYSCMSMVGGGVVTKGTNPGLNPTGWELLFI
jgi:hypothetical protein